MVKRVHLHDMCMSLHWRTAIYSLVNTVPQERVRSTTAMCTNGMERPPSVEGASDQGREQGRHPPLPLAASVGIDAVAPRSCVGSFVIVFDE